MRKTAKVQIAFSNIAKIMSTLLCAVLYICANTSSSTLIHEPEAPDDLKRFKIAK